MSRPNARSARYETRIIGAAVSIPNRNPLRSWLGLTQLEDRSAPGSLLALSEAFALGDQAIGDLPDVAKTESFRVSPVTLASPPSINDFNPGILDRGETTPAPATSRTNAVAINFPQPGLAPEFDLSPPEMLVFPMAFQGN